jgi:4-amino-4-deoxy-L-arabinose transferase-like glycosyltransferase
MPDPGSRSRFRLSDTTALWLTGLFFTLIHLAGSGRYGFHRDELLTYSNARHLDWCYVVYPPLTAWLARVELFLFGTSLIGFRSFATIAVGLAGVLCGLIARELGGGRRAMLVSCVAFSIAGPIMFSGAFLSYMTFDIVWWTLAAFFIARLIRTGNPRCWLGVGVAIGLGVLTKYTILFFVAGILGGLILTPNRRWFRSAWFWAAIALAAAIATPVTVWQIHHHFVGLDWMKSIHARDIKWGRTDYFLLSQLWKVTNPPTIPLWCAGLWYLFGAPAGRKARILGWMFVIPLVLFLIARGRDYYLTPAYSILMAAGAVWGEQWVATLTPRGQAIVLRVTRNALAIGALIIFALILPIPPINSAWWRVANAANDGFNMELGWPEIAATAAQIRDSLPPGQRSSVGILAGDEGEAGAINLYGPAYHLPEAISGMNQNYLRGYGNPPPQTVIVLGMPHDFIFRSFESCRVVARLDNPNHVVNETVGGYSDVYLCGPPVKGWPAFWEHFQYYG